MSAPTQPAEPSKEELQFVRRLQNFYCDCIVGGCPTGDWHIESTPEQAVRLIRAHVAAQTADLRKELAQDWRGQSQANAQAADNWRAEAAKLSEQGAELRERNETLVAGLRLIANGAQSAESIASLTLKEAAALSASKESAT